MECPALLDCRWKTAKSQWSANLTDHKCPMIFSYNACRNGRLKRPIRRDQIKMSKGVQKMSSPFQKFLKFYFWQKIKWYHNMLCDCYSMNMQLFWTPFRRLHWGFVTLDILGFQEMSNLQKVNRLLFCIFINILLSCMIFTIFN